MGGCQNDGPFLGVLVKEDIDVDIDTDSEYGWWSKLWSLFGSPNTRYIETIGNLSKSCFGS